MKKNVLVILTLLLTISLAVVVLAQSSGSNIFKDIKLITDIITKVSVSYVDPIDTHKFIIGGIRGLLSGLDQHTVYMTPKDFEDLKTRTSGEFGGLGILLGMRDNILTVISPMEGTPAYRMGIKAGDKIVAIEGKPTKGMSTDDAVAVLRGEPGTKVTITILRAGEPDPIEYTITRDIIHIDAVPFAGMTQDSIGYIRLATFSEDAGTEVRMAVDSLNRIGMKALIFDLRSNPGGLLNQAVDVASVFLKKGDLVVYTKGKSKSEYREYKTYWSGGFTEKPLIILIDGGSASASEIVAGAIQDNDRGLIVGTRTFGKGLVQSVIPLEEGALKITTAHYYIPSGRCIQKEDYLKKAESVILRPDTSKSKKATEEFETDRWWEQEGDIDDAEGDEGVPADAPIYYTKKGRIVYGGGGITPDMFIEQEKLSRLVLELERKNMFFSFAVDYTVENRISHPEFEVDNKLFNEFLAYLKEKKFDYKSVAEIEIAGIESTIVQLEYGDGVTKAISNLKQAISTEKEKDYERNRKYIERAIKREIVSSIWGEDANYQYVILKSDPVIARAVSIFREQGEYEKALAPQNRKQ